jgi:glycosyltransferase involved in cell wall biosynthesis
MKVFITSEERFVRTADRRLWSRGPASYSFWKRYLGVFDQVHVLARVASVTTLPASWKRADGEGVTIDALPNYLGPFEYATQYFPIKAAIRKALSRTGAIILRAPSPIAHCLQQELALGRPFGVEVVGDPYEVFAPGSVKHPMRPFLRWLLTNQLKRQCREACAVAYVTKSALQRRYRANEAALSTACSGIELGDGAFVRNPRNFAVHPRPIRVISVGTMEVLYKGFDILIDAVSVCIKAGLDIELVIAGDGRCRPELERRAQLRGIVQHVRFAGHIPNGTALRNELDQADIFVLASKTEGLPRAMIEAMSRALPCIGSGVGGIPELLAPEELVPRGDAMALARIMKEVIKDPVRMTRMSALNLAKARDYHDSVLTTRRLHFLGHVLQASQEWNRRHASVNLESDTIADAAVHPVGRYP